MALTCGEETAGAFNGAQYLAKNKRDLIDAEFALNEGGGGMLDGNGKPLEPASRSARRPRRITARGHQSRRPQLAAGAATTRSTSWPTRWCKISGYEFPVQFNDTTRAYLRRMAARRGAGRNRRGDGRLGRQPERQGRRRARRTRPGFNSILRTTCVATMLDGGHATNALPQRAGANVNCRIFPGHLGRGDPRRAGAVVADPGVTITALEPLRRRRRRRRSTPR